MSGLLNVVIGSVNEESLTKLLLIPDTKNKYYEKDQSDFKYISNYD
jgi:hypothetical protein